jgi:hypothetical protein
MAKASVCHRIMMTMITRRRVVVDAVVGVGVPESRRI